MVPALSAEDDIDEVAYEVADWPVGSRLRLTSVLAERGIPWRWETGLNLVVREDDDVRTEAALDEIEAEELGTAATNAPGIGADGGNGHWVEGEPSADSDEDDDEEGDGFVGGGVEEYAGELIDEDEDDEDEDDEDEDDGAVAQAAMADLFVAADRLIHDPTNLEFAVDLDTAADVIDASPAPFGIDDGTWSTIRERAAAVRAALDEPEPDSGSESEDDAEVGAEIDGFPTDGEIEIESVDHDAVAEAIVSERAQTLRDTIRPWV
ncbi:MAG TPA: hypothetical protein VM121_08130 [Acidimicrobiales bacterium]|nr:hypothetical protein [Acidimicrobiales bacterium]